jgi:two-component system response regulator FixJ
MEAKRTVYVVDDDPGIRESLAILLETAEYEVRAFGSAEAFLTALKDAEPICAIIDVFLPDMSGLALQQRLADRGIESALIFMTGRADVPMAVQAMRAGALHFIEKPFDAKDLIGVVNDIISQTIELEQRRIKRDETKTALGTLTPREQEVLLLLAEGLQNKVVAARLGISPRTIEHHRSRIMAKMKARTVVDLINAYAGATNLAPRPRR